MPQCFEEIGYPITKIALRAAEVPVADIKADLAQLKSKRMWSPDNLTAIRNTVADSLWVRGEIKALY